jgi:hypothetical protein
MIQKDGSKEISLMGAGLREASAPQKETQGSISFVPKVGA